MKCHWPIRGECLEHALTRYGQRVMLADARRNHPAENQVSHGRPELRRYRVPGSSMTLSGTCPICGRQIETRFALEHVTGKCLSASTSTDSSAATKVSQAQAAASRPGKTRPATNNLRPKSTKPTSKRSSERSKWLPRACGQCKASIVVHRDWKKPLLLCKKCRKTRRRVGSRKSVGKHLGRFTVPRPFAGGRLVQGGLPASGRRR